MTKLDDDRFLDGYFDDAKKSSPAIPDALMARIVADAAAETDRRAQMRARVEPVSVWRQIWQAVGGWPAIAGLSAATLTGVWIGLNPPANVSNALAQAIGQESESTTDYLFDPVSGFEFAMLEG